MGFHRISYKEHEGLTEIGLGLESKNSLTVLDEETFNELQMAIDRAKKKENEQGLRGLLFFSHNPKCFLAGIDIHLISQCKTESEAAEVAERGQALFNQIDDLPFPTVACIHGLCLGGGVELALACKGIILSDHSSTLLGLPEVKLGFMPGFGGSYRLPKKIGLPRSLDLILKGKTLHSKKAKRLGLVEGIYPKEKILSMGKTFLLENLKGKSLKESLENLASDNFLTRKIVFQKARERILKKTKGFYQAPLKILDVMEAGFSKGRSSYLSMESQAFGELGTSDQSRNLQHLYFLTEDSKKYEDKDSLDNSLERGAVIGAGTMGGGISWLMAKNKMFPLMKDVSLEALELGVKQSSENFMSLVKRKKMDYDELHYLQGSLSPQLDYRGFKKVDLVVESIVEDLEVKKKVFTQLEKEVSPKCLIVSNTSSLSISDMATSLEDPSRFAGLHFFNPVHKMSLVEIITHDKVSEETIRSLHSWCVHLKKTPIIVKDGPGFLVNRILIPYLNESTYLLEEGLSLKSLEEACINFGMPIGPGRLFDEIGMDIASKVGKILHQRLGERAKPAKLSTQLEEEGFLGKKNGRGFYLYDDKGKEIGLNKDFLALLPHETIKMDEVQIQMRLFLPMINEAANILEEGLVDHASSIDLALIFGIGFPPFRGGLLRYADKEGLERILKALEGFSKTVDPKRYGPSKYLTQLVEQKKKFYE